MEQNKIFVPGNLRQMAEYFPVPTYFENAHWRLFANAVWLGLQLLGALALLVLSIIIVGPQWEPPLSFFVQLFIIGLPALIMAVIFANGSLDLSVGSVAGLTGIVTAQFIVEGVPPEAAILFGLIIALLFGLFNAAVVGLARLPGFIVTFVVYIAARMLILLVAQGKTIGPALQETDPRALPFLAGLFGLILLGGVFVWTQWPAFNSRLTQREGKAIGRFRLALPFLVSSLAAGVAGVIILGYVGYGTTSGGMYLEFNSVLVVALAGTCFYGRYVNVVGVVLGAVMFVLLQLDLSLANVGPAVSNLAIVALLVLAVGFTYLYHFIVGLLYRASLRRKEAAPQT